MVFDTSYLYFRAYFGVPNRFFAEDGRPVNAVRGTLDFISRLLAVYSPDEFACAWDDAWRPAWRVELVPSYKTHRLVENAGAEAEQVEDDLSVQVPLRAGGRRPFSARSRASWPPLSRTASAIWSPRSSIPSPRRCSLWVRP